MAPGLPHTRVYTHTCPPIDTDLPKHIFSKHEAIHPHTHKNRDAHFRALMYPPPPHARTRQSHEITRLLPHSSCPCFLHGLGFFQKVQGLEQGGVTGREWYLQARTLHLPQPDIPGFHPAALESRVFPWSPPNLSTFLEMALGSSPSN